MIWRDDDISDLSIRKHGENVLRGHFTLERFAEIDSLFVKYGQIHTIAVITKGIENSPDLIDYINRNKDHISIQLHCHEHLDFTTLSEDEIMYQFSNGLRVLEKEFDAVPLYWFPPWNRTNDFVNGIAREMNLTPSWEKRSLSSYLITPWYDDVINFHYWSDECVDLERALEKYTCK